ncbi:MAG TPA: MbcA/ParS/Xre antitoxin family protein [Bradyrhizobium sp.]|jgi:putative toxin-antitoxin system antitoxin component (TIGR02293 family)|nr:MbcA/ParS/Xre antitoxin family protein [Bradyrhizobium sp.]
MSPELVAERVFGDKEKAKAWLNRPNPSLSGRRPIDLLKDEAGTSIIREILERIDHGVFG